MLLKLNIKSSNIAYDPLQSNFGEYCIRSRKCYNEAQMNKAEILRYICQAKGCVFVRPSILKNPLETSLSCQINQDPTNVLTENGCIYSSIKVQTPKPEGRDIRFGVMKENGFTQNIDYNTPLPNHPIQFDAQLEK